MVSTWIFLNIKNLIGNFDQEMCKIKGIKTLPYGTVLSFLHQHS